jgi:putative tryptophan/tyrosine transport system substrate-binding protein
MRRRELLSLLGGAAVSWPGAGRAQQDGIRRLGVLVASAENDADIQTRLAGLLEGLAKLGWWNGRNLHIDFRYAASRADQYPALAKELVTLQPDVIFAQSTPIVVALQRETHALPVVFVSVSDPVGSGVVSSLARPGGNMTGVLQYEAGITGKWLAMLKEIAPHLAQAALLANPKITGYDHFLHSAQAVTPALAIEVVPTPVENDAAEISHVIEAFARAPNRGLLLVPDSTTLSHRDLIISLASRYRLPAVYPFRIWVTSGGLMSYDTDQVELFRQAASYVDRILRGTKPADIPVQAPTKYQTVLNLKTASAFSLDVPPSLLVRADEVIE